MRKCNEDIREAIQLSNFPYWLVASQVGITDSTFSRWLRKELPNDKKQRIIEAIEVIQKENVY